MNAAIAVGSGDAKIAVPAGYGFHPLVLVDIESVVLGDIAVVLECLRAGRLHVRGIERNVADLEQLRRGEKRHVSRIVEEGVDQAALVDNKHFQSDAMGLDRTREAGGTGAND